MYRFLKKRMDSGKGNEDFNKSIRTQIISRGLAYSLATGNWGEQGNIDAKAGVSQVLSRLTFMASLSHLRRINTPLDRSGKQARPRQLHNTHWGMVCPAEVPEGSAVGLVKNLSLMTLVTVGVRTDDVLDFLSEWGVENLADVEPGQIVGSAKVFVNGAWVGIRSEPEELVETFRDMRRKGDIATEVSVVYDRKSQELRLMTDAGRPIRPLFIVDQEEQKLKIKSSHVDRIRLSQDRQKEFPDEEPDYGWEDVVEDGLVEFVDVAEEETLMIAMSPVDLTEENQYSSSYTHCEIHASQILGICASVIPFPDHNQSPRNTYQSAMGKQALGVYASNYVERMDTLAHVLYYAQSPLVSTRSMEFMHFRHLPAGINAIVAIMVYGGYNQEDSVLFNQSAIDRGFFRSMFYRSFFAKEERDGRDASKNEVFHNPQINNAMGLKMGSYRKLDSDGFVQPGTRVSRSDVLIGKTKPMAAMMAENSQGRREKRKDESISMRPTEDGIVDKVMLSTDRNGNRCVKVRIRNIRIPQVGDKFASRHGQKGTVGMAYRQEDMPFTQDGVVPDIIVNPHAIPSRMTIGHLVECLLSKVGALKGEEGDATPFTDVTVSHVSDKLHRYGYQKRGNETMYNGHTGQMFQAKVFIGPTYYQRLKHMVDDKIHSRSRGPTAALTRQPLEGRGREGGLRFGEMERDCLIAHGSANFLRDRLFWSSDAYRIHVCDRCGMFCHADLSNGTFECRHPICKKAVSGVTFSQIHIPYACKLLFQELMAMAIVPKIITREEDAAPFRN